MDGVDLFELWIMDRRDLTFGEFLEVYRQEEELNRAPRMMVYPGLAELFRNCLSDQGAQQQAMAQQSLRTLGQNMASTSGIVGSILGGLGGALGSHKH